MANSLLMFYKGPIHVVHYGLLNRNMFWLILRRRALFLKAVAKATVDNVDLKRSVKLEVF